MKRVPISVWRKARRNAVDSNMSFRDYLICLMSESKPLNIDEDQDAVDQSNPT